MSWPWGRDPEPEPEEPEGESGGDPETTPGPNDKALRDFERTYKRRSAFRRGDPK